MRIAVGVITVGTVPRLLDDRATADAAALLGFMLLTNFCDTPEHTNPTHNQKVISGGYQILVVWN